MGYYTKKEIVGWGAPPNTTCDYCNKRQASVIVVETDGYPGPQLWSCNECTPAHSCEDHIANKLGEVMTSILAANNPA